MGFCGIDNEREKSKRPFDPGSRTEFPSRATNQDLMRRTRATLAAVPSYARPKYHPCTIVGDHTVIISPSSDMNLPSQRPSQSTTPQKQMRQVVP